ncbi:MAG: hypothetical protein JPMHGGIA_01531 [Saprospiraceae bacterium]|nr:hypothetical protein [Saprospiraceae bacterium]
MRAGIEMGTWVVPGSVDALGGEYHLDFEIHANLQYLHEILHRKTLVHADHTGKIGYFFDVFSKSTFQLAEWNLEFLNVVTLVDGDGDGDGLGGRLLALFGRGQQELDDIRICQRGYDQKKEQQEKHDVVERLHTQLSGLPSSSTDIHNWVG